MRSHHVVCGQVILVIPYIYLVVSRGQTRVFDPDVPAERAATATNGKVAVYFDRVAGHDTDGNPYTEAFLRCHSPARERKETSILEQSQTRFETKLPALRANLSKPRTRQNLAYVQRKIGQLRSQNASVAPHDTITVMPDPTHQKAVDLNWELHPQAGAMMDKPGDYSLRSNCPYWDAEEM